jgi:hypothetical protein
MRRTSPDKEKEVLTSILMGDAYAVVSEKTGVPVSTIKKIKKRSDIQMAHLHTHVMQEQADNAQELLQQTNRQIARLLAQDELGLITISVNDLCRISTALHAQTVINSSPLKPVQTLTKVAQKYQ